MKKTLSVLLALLMVMFTCSAVVYAQDEDQPAEKASYTITFLDYDGKVIATRLVEEGGIVKAPENPTREKTDEYEYIFKGWSADNGETIYHASTMPLASADVTYKAIYSEQKIEEPFTLMKFIASIFQRINAVFEYFARIFGRVGRD